MPYDAKPTRDEVKVSLTDEIRKLGGRGTVTMSILQKREEIGILKGRQEGRQERNIEIAKNLIKEGVEIALIVKATGLSKSQVERLNLLP